MEIGLQIPQWGSEARREHLLRLAGDAEAAGFASLWVSDHLVYPLGQPAVYPHNATGAMPFAPKDGYLEALTTLAVIAGSTHHIRLGTSVLILPMRPVLLTAKALSTLHVLSEGRLSIAVAAGWWKAEFDALGADFAKRGKVLDAQLEALGLLWRDGLGSYSGPGVTFRNVVAEPKPVQPGGPPVWIGGHGARIWERVARPNITGWHGIGYDTARIAAALAGIGKACAVAGRAPSSVRLSTATGLPATADRMLERIELLHEAGLSQIVFIPRSENRDAVFRTVELFGTRVASRVPTHSVPKVE